MILLILEANTVERIMLVKVKNNVMSTKMRRVKYKFSIVLFHLMITNKCYDAIEANYCNLLQSLKI